MAGTHGARRARAGTAASRGSRRWRTLRRGVRRAEARHRARVRNAHHGAAKEVVEWCAERGVGTLVVDDPKGICGRDCGPVHNKRLRDWSRTHLMGCLVDKAELWGITVVRADERGSSSTCPSCRQRVPKPKGRVFSCPHCEFSGHRDLVGASNIARSAGGTAQPLPTAVEHRRAARVPARRDRRRHRWDLQRSSPALPSPEPPATQAGVARAVRVDHANAANVG